MTCSCPTCGHTIRPPAPPSTRVCWACGKTFTQQGKGRARVVCHDKACIAKRRHYRLESGAALDRMVE